MELVKINCSKCGAQVLADRSRDKWYCGYCGFLLATNPQANCPEPKKKTETEIGLAEVTQLIENGECDRAIAALESLCEQFPLTFALWETLLNAHFSKCKQQGFLMGEKDMTFLAAGAIEKAKKRCPAEKRAALEETINGFFREADEKLRRGEFHLLSPKDGWSEYGTEKALHKIKYSHPLMEKAVADAKAITRNLASLNIHFGLPHQGGVMNESDASFWPDFREQKPYCGVKTFVVFGRDCFVGFWGADGSHLYCYYPLPFLAEDNDAFYEKAAAIAKENVLKLPKCPVCSGTQLKIKKETLLGKKRIWKCGVCGSFCVF